MNKVSATQVTDRILSGDTFRSNGWSISINASDEIEIWPPEGEGLTASLMHLDRAVDHFVKKSQELEFSTNFDSGNIYEFSDGNSLVEDNGTYYLTDFQGNVLTSFNDLGALPPEYLSQLDSWGSAYASKKSTEGDITMPEGTDGFPAHKEVDPQYSSLGQPEEAAKSLSEFNSGDSVKQSAEGDTKMPEGSDGFPEHKKVEPQYESLGSPEGASKSLSTWQKGVKKESAIVDTFNQPEDPNEIYRKLQATRPSAKLLEGIMDEEAWASKLALDSDEAFEESDMDFISNYRKSVRAAYQGTELEEVIQKSAGPKIKETWGDYSRDLEAESAEDLYHLVRSFGQEDVYDWSGMRRPDQMSPAAENMPDQMGPTTSVPPTTGLQPPGMNTVALDSFGKEYYQDYFGEYGDQLVKDEGVDKRKERKEKKEDDGKEAQAAPMAPAAPQTPPAAPQAPGGTPTPGKPSAPAPMPSGGPQGVPGKPAPGAGNAGLEALGWLQEDIQGMDEQDKQKILQIQLQKPGTKGKGAPMPSDTSKGPAPGGPTPQAPETPAAPPAPIAECGGPKTSERRKLAFQIMDKIRFKRAQDMLNQPVQEPVVEQPQAPGLQDYLAPPMNQDYESVSGDPSQQAFSIMNDVIASEVAVTDKDQVAIKKLAEFQKRLEMELGMTMEGFQQMSGLSEDEIYNTFKS